MFSDASSHMRPVTTQQEIEGGVVATRRKGCPAGGIAAKYKTDSVVQFILFGSPLGGGMAPVPPKYRRVALQIPDTFLPDAVKIVLEVEATCKRELLKLTAALDDSAGLVDAVKVFLLADNTFGSCCPDEITASHYFSDCIIHFGDACLSKTTRLPMFYVHDENSQPNERAPTVADDSAPFLSGLQQALELFINEAQSLLRTAPHDVTLVLVASPSSFEFTKRLLQRAAAVGLPSACLVVKKIIEMWSDDAAASPFVSDEWGTRYNLCLARPEAGVDNQWVINGMRFPYIDQITEASDSRDSQRRRKSQCFMFFGNEANAMNEPPPQLLHLRLVQAYNDCYHRSTESAEDEAWLAHEKSIAHISSATGKFSIDSGVSDRLVQTRLRQRMHNIEVIKSAESIGIFVASLAITGYRETAFALREAIRKIGGKRCYVIYIGHLNEFKAANFVDTVDCFCVIACPNSRLAQFPNKKIDNFMKPMVSPVEVAIALGVVTFENACAFTTDFVSTLPYLQKSIDAFEAQKKIEPSVQREVTGELIGVAPASSRQVFVTQGGSALNGSLTKLHQKSYLGLDPLVGQTAVQDTLQQGKSGIARGYETERSTQPQLE